MINGKSDELALAIDSHIRSLITERDDWQFAHVSDCYGCDRSTWERRQRTTAPTNERDGKSCLKMALGNDVERYVCDGLQTFYEAKGYATARDYRVIWDPHNGRGTYTWAREEIMPLPNYIVGHADFHAWHPNGESILLECKSTSFFRGKAPTEPSLHYVEQAATYAIAVGATHAGIIIACRESGRIAGPFWLDLDALEFATIERAKAVIANTSPDNMIPPAAFPRYSWQPKYCSMGAECACLAAANADKTAHQLEASLK